MIDERAIRKRYTAIRDQVDERGRRLFAAAEARAVGRGGIAAVARATGLARSTIERGLKDLDRAPLPVGQVRRAGSGRRPLSTGTRAGWTILGGWSDRGHLATRCRRRGGGPRGQANPAPPLKPSGTRITPTTCPRR